MRGYESYANCESYADQESYADCKNYADYNYAECKSYAGYESYAMGGTLFITQLFQHSLIGRHAFFNTP